MAESSSGQDTRKETSQADEYFVQGNYPPGFVVPPRYFTQHLYYPYVNPYSHLTESNGNLSIHGYGSDGRYNYGRLKFLRKQLKHPHQMFWTLHDSCTTVKFPSNRFWLEDHGVVTYSTVIKNNRNVACGPPLSKQLSLNSLVILA